MSRIDLSIPQHFTKEQSKWIKAYCIKRNMEFYNKAIDDFITKAEEERDRIYNWDNDEYENGVKTGYQYSIEIAEELKGDIRKWK